MSWQGGPVGRPRLIDRDSILDAGLAVADDVGVDRLTMQAVARRLDVTPMALYRHVADKADLLDGVVEKLLREVELPDPASPAEDQLRLMGRSMRAVARRHPTVFPLLLQRPATTPAARAARDRVLELLGEMGVPEDDRARVERLVSTMVLGFAASEAGGRFGRHPRREIDADFEVLEDTIATLIVERTEGDR